MRTLIIIVAVLVSGNLCAQIGVSAGGSLLNGFGQSTPWGGLHIGVEVPRDDQTSFYGRITHHFKQYSADSILTFAEANELTTTPYTVAVSSLASMNYTILEGGTRYYIGNGYDFGWAAYGGTNFMLIFNSVNTEYSDFDETLYSLPNEDERKGSIVSLSLGLAGGVKYTVAGTGTFYFDANLSYALLGVASNQTATDTANELYSSLLFNFNLGFRKDILW